MGPAYLDEFVQELRRLGELAFRRRYVAPVLIVSGRAPRPGRPRTHETGRLTRPVRATAGHPLVDRVFAIAKGEGAPLGPVAVGRTADNDVTIPEYSISKRHCVFELRDGATSVTDCGSTNGTLLNGVKLEGRGTVPLCGGEVLTMGRFQFRYETPAGFLELVSGLARGRSPASPSGVLGGRAREPS